MIIKAVEKAIDILDCFSSERPFLSVQEISELTGLTPSTASRILSTLRKKNCVDKDGASGRYHLGARVYRWGQIVANQFNLSQVALPAMEKLRDACGEEVALYVLQGDARFCVAKVESKFSVAKTSVTGVALPLHCGAAGKVLLAYLPVPMRKRLLEKPLEKYTPFTITDPEQLERNLEEIRREGCAYSVSEREVGAYSIVAPVRDALGQVVASLAISGPQFRLSDEKVEIFKKMVKDTAQEISHNLGFPKA
ncbi:MAG TPA: IclR family transcriptional regulator [Firmicutes bacterium]|nr:IclR family transcriptional regulator [Bacillota bacterium]